MKSYKQFGLYFILLLLSCKTKYIPVKQEQRLYKVESNVQTDSVSKLALYLKPYHDSLDKKMNAIIGEAQGDFIKEKPGGSLGNLVVDALMDKCNNMLLSAQTPAPFPKIDGAICNYGGLRINQISKGKINIGKIYELLPFDNELVIVEIKGRILKQWFAWINTSEGWPISASLSNKASFDDDTNYYIATNDYVANGGDKCDFLIPCKRIQTGITVRDVVINYIEKTGIVIPDQTKRKN